MRTAGSYQAVQYDGGRTCPAARTCCTSQASATVTQVQAWAGISVTRPICSLPALRRATASQWARATARSSPELLIIDQQVLRCTRGHDLALELIFAYLRRSE